MRLRKIKFKKGMQVELVDIPEWVREMPSETQKAFQVCLHRRYSIADVTDDGLLVLDVAKDVDPIIGGKYNDLRVEPRYVKAVPRK